VRPAAIARDRRPNRVCPGDKIRELWLLKEGARVLILIRGDRSYASAAAEAGKKLLASRL
jgi:hypothetical protein